MREFAASQTPADGRDDFCRDCAARLLAAYGDVARLERHCADRSVTALEADLTSAVHLLTDSKPPNHPITASLLSLQRILERESHVLRHWETEQRPAFFAHQLRHRALLSGDARLMVETAARLADLAKAYKLRYVLLAIFTGLQQKGVSILSVLRLSLSFHALQYPIFAFDSR